LEAGRVETGKLWRLKMKLKSPEEGITTTSSFEGEPLVLHVFLALRRRSRALASAVNWRCAAHTPHFSSSTTVSVNVHMRHTQVELCVWTAAAAGEVSVPHLLSNGVDVRWRLDELVVTPFSRFLSVALVHSQSLLFIFKPAEPATLCGCCAVKHLQ